MKELKCPNCGGHVIHKGWGKYHCEYCGTDFENKDEAVVEILALVSGGTISLMFRRLHRAC